MRVLFIYPDISSWSVSGIGRIGFSGWYNFGLGYLSTALKKSGHITGLYHITKMPRENEFMQKIKLFNPGLIGFSLNSNSFFYLAKMAEWIDKNSGIRVICGGPHPSLNPQETLAVRGVNMVCVGEGEEALTELCTALDNGSDITKIKNICIKDTDKLTVNPVRPATQNLDTLGLPDRSIFNFDRLELSKIGIYSFTASRGCPYDCSYCCNTKLMKISGNTTGVRFRSVDNLIQEIIDVIIKYRKPKCLLFEDNILPLNKRWFEEFCKKYAKEIRIPFAINSSANYINEETVRLLKLSGCESVNIGVETGNEVTRREILGKNISNREIIKAFDLLSRSGIKSASYNMVGLPFETSQDLLNTIKFNSRLKIEYSIAQIYYPYKKTALYELCKEKEMLKDITIPNIDRRSILINNHLTVNQILFFQLFFNYLVKIYSKLYKHKNKTVNLLDSLLLSKIIKFAYPVLSIAVDFYRISKYLILGGLLNIFRPR